MENNKRIFGYDLIKTFAIFLIVFYHLGGLDYGTISPDTYYIPNLNKFLSSFCAAGVPLFLMVNGALVLPKRINLKQTIIKSLHFLFILVFWKVVLQYFIAEWLLSIQENMVHFWFLGTLAIVYIVSFFLNRNNWLKITVLSLLFVYPFLSNFFFDIFVFIHFESIPEFWMHTGFYTLYAFVFFYLGDFIGRKDINPFISIVLVFIGLLLINFEVIALSNHYHMISDSVNGSFPTIGAMALSTGIFMLFKNINIDNDKIRSLIFCVGRNTLGIYLFHVLVLFILRGYYPYQIYNLCLLTAFFISFLIIAATAFISEIILNTKFSFLVSVSNTSLKSFSRLFNFLDK